MGDEGWVTGVGGGISFAKVCVWHVPRNWFNHDKAHSSRTSHNYESNKKKDLRLILQRKRVPITLTNEHPFFLV